MDIKTDLPFAHCDFCPEFILDVEEQVLFSTDSHSQRVLTIKCKYEWLCKQLSNRLEEQKNASDGTGECKEPL